MKRRFRLKVSDPAMIFAFRHELANMAREFAKAESPEVQAAMDRVTAMFEMGIGVAFTLDEGGERTE